MSTESQVFWVVLLTAPATLIWIWSILAAIYAGESKPDTEAVMNVVLSFVPVVVHFMVVCGVIGVILEKLADKGAKCRQEILEQEMRLKAREKTRQENPDSYTYSPYHHID